MGVSILRGRRQRHLRESLRNLPSKTAFATRGVSSREELQGLESSREFVVGPSSGRKHALRLTFSRKSRGTMRCWVYPRYNNFGITRDNPEDKSPIGYLFRYRRFIMLWEWRDVDGFD